MITSDTLTFEGITQPITEWALDYGIYPAVITDRLARGWTIERAITTPMIVAPRQRLSRAQMPALPKSRRLDAKEKAQRVARSHRTIRPSALCLIEHKGQSFTLAQWSDQLGIPLTTLRRRIKDGWPLDLALKPGCMSGRPGVVKNLPAYQGTGGGSLAQDVA